ncbi:MAG: hypothetical protein SCALA702_21070 [Melioribacteraceae bacterium]|nr:MAG: hypothetical protein SCALA702_21070 [Melioribacteraceae bacterium]
MKNKKYLTVILLGVMLVTLSGCIGVNRNFKQVRSHVLSNVEGSFKKEAEFRVGKGLITLAGMFVSFAENETEVDVKGILRNLDRVQVGIYKNRNSERIDFSRAGLVSLCEIMEDRGMYYIVRSIDNDELTGVFLHDNDTDEIRDMYVVHFDQRELVIVEIKGDLDDIIAIALQEANHRIDFTESVAKID